MATGVWCGGVSSSEVPWTEAAPPRQRGLDVRQVGQGRLPATETAEAWTHFIFLQLHGHLGMKE
jgi:hypothetical protein